MHIKITRARIKMATSVIVGGSVAAIVGQVIRHNTDEPQNLPEKVQRKLGSYTIGSLVAGAATDKTDRIVDGLFDFFEKDDEETPEIEQKQTDPTE